MEWLSLTDGDDPSKLLIGILTVVIAGLTRLWLSLRKLKQIEAERKESDKEAALERERQRKDVEAQRDDLRERAEALDKRYDSLYADLRKEVHARRDEAHRLSLELAVLREQKDALQRQLDKQESEVRLLEDEVTRLRAEVKTRDDTISGLRGEVDSLRRELARYKSGATEEE